MRVFFKLDGYLISEDAEEKISYADLVACTRGSDFKLNVEGIDV